MAGTYFKVPVSKINRALSEYVPSNMRGQLLTTPQNTILLDAYNANPDSMSRALQHFFSLRKRNKVLILGDMLELGKNAKEEHRKILNILRQRPHYRVFLVGPVFSGLGRSKGLKCFKNTGTLIQFLKKEPLA